MFWMKGELYFFNCCPWETFETMKTIHQIVNIFLYLYSMENQVDLRPGRPVSNEPKDGDYPALVTKSW